MSIAQKRSKYFVLNDLPQLFVALADKFSTKQIVNVNFEQEFLYFWLCGLHMQTQNASNLYSLCSQTN